MTLRLPERRTFYLAALAQSNNRTFAAEVNAALAAHEALSRLAAVTDQDVQRQLHDDSKGLLGVVGESAERVAGELRAELARIWGKAFFVDRVRGRRALEHLFGPS